MINDYKLDADKIYIFSNKDDQYPAWHHPYLKDCGAGTIADIVPQIEEFKRIVIKDAAVDSECRRAVRLGSNIYYWNDEVKAFARKRQAQVRKQNGNTDAILVSHQADAELLAQLKNLGYKRAGKKDLRYGGSGTEFTLKKFFVPVTNFPEYTWAATIKKPVGVDRDGNDITRCSADISLVNTDNKNIFANGWWLSNARFGRYGGYRDIGIEAEDMIDRYVQTLNINSTWEKKSELVNQVYSWMQSQGLKFDEGYVFNTDFQQNYRRGDNLYNNFNDLRLDGKTAEEMDTTIQGIIDNANRLTTDPAAIRQHNEEVERQVVAKTREVIEGDQDYGFGESLKNKKELTLSEMLDEVED